MLLYIKNDNGNSKFSVMNAIHLSSSFILLLNTINYSNTHNEFGCLNLINTYASFLNIYKKSSLFFIDLSIYFLSN